MTDELRQTLERVLPFVAGLALIAFAVRRRGLSWREDVRLVWPSGARVAGWLFAWIAWVALEEFLSRRAGLSAPTPWHISPLALGLRVIGIVALALGNAFAVYQRLG